ncbi:glycosyltransferase family 2 protein [Telmatobacter bradus]|uniref:glycosyltransferase family 2 protein n=1 Tax=Telmatobacter bradus TaxID=474953 RepID=UPI003B428F0A
MRKSLSVVLITLNEAANLPRTLASVRWADEIVVVDSGSTDGTEQIAIEAHTHFFTEPWHGFAAQKNNAIRRASCDWVLSLDADEELSPALQSEIQQLLQQDEIPSQAYRIPRLNHFLSQPLRHGGYWPDPKLRLFRKGTACFRERAVHESMELTGENQGSVKQLQGHLIHHCYPTLEEYVEHMNRYSSAAARQLVASGRAPRSLAGLFAQAILNPAATFLYNYIVRLGFLDGLGGLLQHLNHSVYIHWKYVKAWELARQPQPVIDVEA